MKKISGKKLVIASLCLSMLAGQAVYAAELPETEPKQPETEVSPVAPVDLSQQPMAIAGIGVVLDDYYAAYTSGIVTKSLTDVLTTMTSEASSVLDHYTNLGIANVDNYLNVRKKASTNGEIIGKMTTHTGCDILETSEDGAWYKVKSGTVEGWVSAEYILTGEEAEKIAVEEARYRAIVTTDSNLNVRQEPNTDSKIINKISMEERYVIAEELDGWFMIELGTSDKDGEMKYGFISSDYAEARWAIEEAVEFSPLSGSTTRDKVVNFAVQYLGNRYVYGGSSLTKGTDCSGFTMGVMKNYGVKLPHSSRAQAKMGKTISSKEMRPGDLVFYGNPIDHVAIYIGNGKIVHAANPRAGIIISRWNYTTPTKIVNVLGNR